MFFLSMSLMSGVLSTPIGGALMLVMLSACAIPGACVAIVAGAVTAYARLKIRHAVRRSGRGSPRA